MSQNSSSRLKLSAFFLVTIFITITVSQGGYFAEKTKASTFPTAHWKFDDGSETVAFDSSGNGKNGTLTNGPMWTTGKINGGLDFDGVNDYVVVPDTGGFDGSAMTQLTVSAWVNVQTFATQRGLVSKGSASFGLLQGSQTNDWRWIVASTACNVDIPNTVTSGWHMVTGTFTGSTDCRLYVDGVQIGIDTVGIPAYIPDTATSITIGCFATMGACVDAAIDDVRIYNEALSAVEIADLYSAYSTDTISPSVPENLIATPFSSYQINLLWNASTDDFGVAGYKIFRDTAQIATTTDITYADTGLLPNTIYTYTVSAYDAAGNESAESLSAQATTTALDITPPNVFITSPLSDSTLFGSVSITASSSDNDAVSGVQFLLDGGNLGTEDTAYPYSAVFDTTTVLNGSHFLAAVARDSSGNVATSSVISVSVDNIIVSNSQIPLVDLQTGDYLGFSGGLYENGTNAVPGDHDAVGRALASTIVPLDTNGSPSPNGKIVLMSVGVSLTTEEWCMEDAAATTTPCSPWTFTGQALATSTVNASTLVIANGAFGSQRAILWDQAFGADPDIFTLQQLPNGYTNNYDRVSAEVLTPKGLSEAQVQVVWLQAPNGPYYNPNILPSLNSDAYELEVIHGNILRALKLRYSNLKQVFISNPAYGGYSEGISEEAADEPHFYESAFSMKWLIQAQIDQMRNDGAIMDQRAGDLNYATGAAPWISWGPYLWANGSSLPRSDGLLWPRSDIEPDGVHMDVAGETKVGTMLLDFFLKSPHTLSWFRATTTFESISPVVTITSPVNSAVVSGVKTITVNASDNIGIAGVQFQIDGVAVGGEDLAFPYFFLWNTANVSAGSHAISAIARDLAGNFSTSTIVNVTVNNGSFPSSLAQYQFNEGSGTIATDSSGNGYAGVLMNGPMWQITGNCKNGASCLGFDGANDYVSIPDSGGFDGIQTTQATFNIWVNLNSISQKGILTKSGSFNLMNGSFSNSWQLNIGSGLCNIQVPNIATTNSWHMVTGTFIGGVECRLYLDGQQVGIDTTNIPLIILDTTADLIIGSFAGTSGFVNGKIDEVRIYNTALDSQAISTLYNSY